MNTSRSIMVLLSLLFNLFLFLSIPVLAQTEFTFRGFHGNKSEIRIDGAATIEPGGLLRLTNRDSNVTGSAFYHKPVRLLETNSANANATKIRSFSTSFVFVIIPESTSDDGGGFGFTFAISPTPNRPNADSAGYLGLLSKENNGDPRNHVFAVEFDTVQGANDFTDKIGNDIGLDYNNRTSDFQEPVYYQNDEMNRKEDFQLESGYPIQAVLNYDGETQTLNVTVYPANLPRKPRTPLISRKIPRLLEIVQEEMFVGFTAATGKKVQSSAHYIMGWSFSTRAIAERLNLSELPTPPKNIAAKKKKGLNSQVVVLIVALSAVMMVMFVLLFFFMMYKKRLRQEEILEDWEIDHPRRFKYRDLHVATDGFNENRIIGTGGFGTVYRGSISSSLCDQIAVKKITPNGMQGIREFVAEIDSLGKLRHKNLVNLQGWCKHKNDLLLIYDYISNGSLDSLLYSVPRRIGFILSWNARFQIAKGIASGLLYLHEEWEKIVIHRDVKPSNVLIEDDMNPKLGDFGLARLYERGTLSQSQTTALVGTVGYVAPELARNGKPSSASDVFAFGVLLLEIVSGRKPTNSVNFFLVDWVMELHTNDETLDAIDPKLENAYNEGEAKLVLAVGLLCCHHNAAFRPSMRMVLRYLNGDEDVPEIDDNWGYSNSARSDLGSRFVFASSSSSSAFSFVTRVSSISVITAG